MRVHTQIYNYRSREARTNCKLTAWCVNSSNNAYMCIIVSIRVRIAPVWQEAIIYTNADLLAIFKSYFYYMSDLIPSYRKRNNWYVIRCSNFLKSHGYFVSWTVNHMISYNNLTHWQASPVNKLTQTLHYWSSMQRNPVFFISNIFI